MEKNHTPQNNSQIKIDDEITLKDIVLKLKEWHRLLLNKWKLLVLVGVLGGVIGLVEAWLKTTTYKAELVFVTAEVDEGGLGKLSSLGSQFGFNLGGGSSGAFGGDNLMELMKSRRLVEQTLFDSMYNERGERVRLLERYLLRDSAQQNEDNPPVELLNSNETPNYRQDSLLSEIHEVFIEDKLSVVKKDEEKAFIVVSFNDQDEFFAKAFVEYLTDNVTSFYLETKTRQSKENIKMLQLKADSIELELSKTMAQAALSKDKNIFVSNTQGLVESAKKQMQAQMLSTMYGEVVKNLELSKTMAAHNEPLIEVIDAPRFPLEKDKASKLKGLVFGGMVAGFLMALWIIGRGAFKEMMGEE